MNDMEFTDQYLKSFDSLSEALYLCWYNSFCNKTKQIDEEKLREQIRSYGFYPFKKKHKKKLPLSFRSRLRFKKLTWVNYFTDVVAEDTICDPSELHLLALKELKTKLLNLNPFCSYPFIKL